MENRSSALSSVGACGPLNAKGYNKIHIFPLFHSTSQTAGGFVYFPHKVLVGLNFPSAPSQLLAPAAVSLPRHPLTFLEFRVWWWPTYGTYRESPPNHWMGGHSQLPPPPKASRHVSM
ncbi:hypothetical protein ACE6H2_016985 [Prunus campanulata]